MSNRVINLSTTIEEAQEGAHGIIDDSVAFFVAQVDPSGGSMHFGHFETAEQMIYLYAHLINAAVELKESNPNVKWDEVERQAAKVRELEAVKKEEGSDEKES